MVFGTQRMRPLGHTAEEMGLHSTQPQNSTAETTLPDPCSARRDKPPPSASHFPLEGSPGWKLQVSSSIYRGEFRLQNPRASRLGPSLQGLLLLCHTQPAQQCQNRDFLPSGSTAMISSFLPDTRHVARGTAAVSPWLWCLLSWSLLPALWSMGWCQCCLPPSCRIWGVMGTSKHKMMLGSLLWALLPMSRMSLQYPCNEHSRTSSGLSIPTPHGQHKIGGFEPNRKTFDAAPLMFLVTGIAASFLLQLLLQKGPSGLS